MKTLILTMALALSLATAVMAGTSLRISVTNDSDRILDFNLYWVNHPFDYDTPVPVCGGEIRPDKTFSFVRPKEWTESKASRLYLLEWTYSAMNPGGFFSPEKPLYRKTLTVVVPSGSFSIKMFFDRDYVFEKGTGI